MQTTVERRSDGSLFIPAVNKNNIFDENHIFRVCAYCRVSTDSEEQMTSFKLQKEHYEQLSSQHSNWRLLHIFADEGISGTSQKHRKEFKDMIARCEAGEFDLIVTKSVSRFARNLLDCVALCRRLKAHNPPIGVFFETDGVFTLSEESEFKLSMLASFAQEESTKKSESMIWSLKQRFKNKNVLNPELFGYDRPRDSLGKIIKHTKLEINEAEAIVVRFIFNAFLAGFSIDTIAEILTENEIPTKLGNTVWKTSSIEYILTNERYCGDILTWKTFTADIFEHTKKKNIQDRDQYLHRNMHDPIISVETFEAAQTVFERYKKGMRGGLHYMQVVKFGALQGYVPINYRWQNDDPSEYYTASDSVATVNRGGRPIQRSQFSAFDLRGYQVVREQFLTSRSELPCLTISNDKISLNGFTMRKLTGESHVQLLLHPTERKVAIRPCEKTDHFSIPIITKTGNTIQYKSLQCPYFNRMLYRIMEWNPDYSYKVIGTWIEKGADQMVYFNLANAMPSVVIEPDSEEKRRTRKTICPDEWGDSFGTEFYDFSIENGIYYLPSGNALNTSVKCQAVDGQASISVMPFEQLMVEADTLKTRMGDTDE